MLTVFAFLQPPPCPPPTSPARLVAFRPLCSIKHRYNSKVMKGFAGSFSDEVKSEIEKVRFPPFSSPLSPLTASLEQHPAVKYVEPDGEVSTQ